MRDRDFDELLATLDPILNSSDPPQLVLKRVKEVLDRAKHAGNLDNELAVPSLGQNHPAAETNGLIEALKEAALKIRGKPDPIAPVASPSPREPSAPVPQGPRLQAFQRCYPMHAKYYTYHTQKSSPFKRAKHQFVSGFTPDASHFALCSATGLYFIYTLPDDLDDGPQQKYTGQLPLDSSKHFYLALNNKWLLLVSCQGMVYVISVDTGAMLWTHQLRFGVRAAAISDSGSYLAVSMPTRSPSGENQSMVLLLCPNTVAEDADAFNHVAEISFVSPYRDPIRNLAFSPCEIYLMCSTSQDSRFFMVSLVDPREPRLVVRSSRKVPHDNTDYEGITSLNFFPRKYGVVITSVATNSPPIVVDPRLNHHPLPSMDGSHQSPSSSSSRSQSQVLLRADKVGSAIHNSVVSPNETSIAFLDKSGLVYIMFWPRSMDHSKKCSVVFEVAGTQTFENCASLQFSDDGTVLYAVDRKGALHMADFGAGLPQTAGISRLRPLS